MFAAALALAAAASWGIGDFLGGLKSRSLRPVAVLIVAQPIGATLLAIWVAARGQGPPGAEVLWACFAAVLVGVILSSLERRPDAARLAAGAGWAAIAMPAFGAYSDPMHAASRPAFL